MHFLLLFSRLEVFKVSYSMHMFSLNKQERLIIQTKIFRKTINFCDQLITFI